MLYFFVIRICKWINNHVGFETAVWIALICAH